MKPPKNTADLTLCWWRLTDRSQRNRMVLVRTYPRMFSWRGEMKIAFRARLAVLRGAFCFDA